MSEGVKRIMLERGRQISEEGWSAEHDDRHTDGSIALAAACYASPVSIYRRVPHELGVDFRDPWPWAYAYDKRDTHDRIRQLEIAGALIAAEIDRLVRAGEGGI